MSFKIILVPCDIMERTSQFPPVEGIEMEAGDPSLAKCPVPLLAWALSQKLHCHYKGTFCKGCDPGHSLPAMALL